MIVTVVLQIATDDGIPAAMAEERQLVIQAAGDLEGNVLKAAAVLDDAVERCRVSMKRQVRQTREIGAAE